MLFLASVKLIFLSVQNGDFRMAGLSMSSYLKYSIKATILVTDEANLNHM